MPEPNEREIIKRHPRVKKGAAIREEQAVPNKTFEPKSDIARDKVVGREAAERAFAEREIRRYLRRDGGFRHNMRDDDCADGQKLIDAYNERYGTTRKVKDGWDTNVHVPHYDNVDHTENQRKLKARTNRK